jgi:predicted transcriptional regulator
MKQPLSELQKAVLEVMSKSKTPAELRREIGLKKIKSISSTLKELVSLGLIYCLNPRAKIGRLYGLTKKGIGARKKFSFKDYCQPHDLDWNSYSYVVCGKQRRAILKAMNVGMPMSSRLIRERANEYNPRISRTNANDILQQFVRKKLAKKIKQGNRVLFRLTRNGDRIKKQLIKT